MAPSEPGGRESSYSRAFGRLIPVILVTWAALLALRALISVWVPRLALSLPDALITLGLPILPALVLASRTAKPRGMKSDSRLDHEDTRK